MAFLGVDIGTGGCKATVCYNGSIVKTKIWQKISEPDISKLFCYATRVTKVK